jgi:hypothetical protein
MYELRVSGPQVLHDREDSKRNGDYCQMSALDQIITLFYGHNIGVPWEDP